jgi:hypothetical protein
MGFLKELKGWLGLDPDSVTRESDISRSNPLFVYIKIPADFGPVERGEIFEDPLQAALEKNGLGEITGGGSQLSDADDEGHRAIEFCGIDLNLYGGTTAIEFLRQELVRLQVPPGTLMIYELEEREWEDPIYPPKPF